MELQNFASLLADEKTSVKLLTGLRDFWKTHKDFWFSHSVITEWPSHEEPYIPTKDTHMTLLLQYDQIARHPGGFTQENHKPLFFRFATALALRMLHNGDYEACETWEKVFVLLCLRHNASVPLKQLAVTKTLALLEEENSELTTEDASLLLRFLNASIWATHEAKAAQGYVPDTAPPPSEPCPAILEAPWPISALRDFKSIEPELLTSFSTLLGQRPERRIAVSISGGVDSMVAAYAAAEVCKQQGKELVLLHINYGNRDTCAAECDLLRWYAGRLGAPLYIREITEMQRCRSTALRSLYEDITRRIRFSFYAWFQCPVILGHNLDDCYENAFRNLAKQIHFENLFGMWAVGQEQNVTTLRPMLGIAKQRIRAYADGLGIPHLVDSTPAWSQRGQMRDKLIPAIAGFDPHILTGLRAFVERSQFLEAQWSQQFLGWCQNLVVRENRLRISRDDFFQSNADSLNFWIRLWQTLALSARPSNKSFRNLMEFLKRGIATQCNLNGVCNAKIEKESVTIVWNQ